MVFFIKQVIKMAFQQVILPIVYKLYAVKPIKQGTILLADAHHDEIPFSLMALKAALEQQEDLHITEMYWNNEHCSAGRVLRNMFEFMKLYAVSQTVVICDNFLPAASCRKRKGTKVIQLWHAGGALKKFGYDTADDIPAYYKGNVMANCNLVTVSAKRCIEPFSSAMRLPCQRVKAMGISEQIFILMRISTEDVGNISLKNIRKQKARKLYCGRRHSGEIREWPVSKD